MKIKPAVSSIGLSLTLAVGVIHMTGCSSVTKPAEADGSTRVPANDASRVQALQQRVSVDRQLLSENNLLRAQVDVLQAKLVEMTTIVREALLLPPAPRPKATAVPSPAVPPLPALPDAAYSSSPGGVVIRVFHPFAKTDFEPSEPVAQALRSSVQGAEEIEVRGHTDSNVVTQIDKLIAMERAEKARVWLISNGVEPSKIRTRYFSSGSFLAENQTSQGRSKNRRVEVDIRNQKLVAARVATNE